MCFSPIAKQNQAEVWPRFQSLLNLLVRSKGLNQSTQCLGSLVPLAMFVVIVFVAAFVVLLVVVVDNCIVMALVVAQVDGDGDQGLWEGVTPQQTLSPSPTSDHKSEYFLREFTIFTWLACVFWTQTSIQYISYACITGWETISLQKSYRTPRSDHAIVMSDWLMWLWLSRIPIQNKPRAHWKLAQQVVDIIRQLMLLHK